MTYEIDKRTVARFKAHAVQAGKTVLRRLWRKTLTPKDAQEFGERAAHWANLWIKYSAEGRR